MIQGGDPERNWIKGGESIGKKPFEVEVSDHLIRLEGSIHGKTNAPIID